MKHILFNQWFEYSEEVLTQEIVNFICSKIESNSLGNLTIIVPTSRLKDYITETISKRAKSTTSSLLLGLRMYSFSEFVTLLYQNVFFDSKRTILSSGIQTSLFEKACEIADLQYYTNKELLKTGYIEDLSKLIFGLKEDGITIDVLEKDCHSQFIEGQSTSAIGKYRFQDIIQIYSQYEQLLAETFLDSVDVLNYCTFSIDQSKDFRSVSNETRENILENKELNLDIISVILTTTLESIPQLFFYGFYHFKIPERQFITALSSQKIGISIWFDTFPVNDEIFLLPESQIDYFTKNGFTVLQNDSCLELDSFIARNLGSFNRKILPKATLKNELQLVQANDRKEEVEYVLHQIKKLTLEQNVPKEDICIVSKDIEAYSELLREESFNSEILLNISDRFSVVSSSVVVALFSLLDIIIHGYRKRDIHRAFGNPYLTFAEKNQSESTINGDNFFHIAEEIRFDGGFENRGLKGWFQKLESEIQYYQKRLEDSLLIDQTSTFELETLQRKLKGRKKAFDDLHFLASLLPKSDILMTTKEFTKSIISLIEMFQIVENIKIFYSEIDNRKYLNEFERNLFVLEAEKDARSLQAVLSILAENELVYKYLYTQKSEENKKFSEHVKRFRYSLLSEKYQIREQRKSNILVTSIEQIRCIPYKYVFVLGMNQGVFPMHYQSEKVLGLQLEQTEHLFLVQELYLFWMMLNRVLSKETIQLSLIYATSSIDEMLLPSSFISDLKAVLDCTEITVDNTKQNIFTKEQLLGVSGKNTVLPVNLQSTFESLFFSDIRSNFENENENEQYELSLFEKQLTDETKAEISSIRTKAFSSSKLELYTVCPYKYMVNDIMQIKEKQEVDEFLSSLNKGTIFHTIVDQFFKSLILNSPSVDKNGLSYVQLQLHKNEQYRELLLSIGEKVIDDYAIEHPYFSFSKEYFLGSVNENNEKLMGLLEIWLQSELERVEEGWNFYPYFFELEFGPLQKQRNGEDLVANTSIVNISDQTSIKGKIDRIEMKLLEDGSYQGIIADYKLSSSTLTKLKDIQDGKKFQLPLYARAFEIYFKNTYNLICTVKGGVYYAFSAPKSSNSQHSLVREFCFIESGIIDIDKPKNVIDSVENLLDFVVENVEITVNAIAESHFEITPSKQSCKYCSYSRICRYKDKL